MLAIPRRKTDLESVTANTSVSGEKAEPVGLAFCIYAVKVSVVTVVLALKAAHGDRYQSLRSSAGSTPRASASLRTVGGRDSPPSPRSSLPI